MNTTPTMRFFDAQGTEIDHLDILPDTAAQDINAWALRCLNTLSQLQDMPTSDVGLQIPRNSNGAQECRG